MKNSNLVFDEVEAQKILQRAYGESASFRNGQLEAIEAVFKNRRILIVQKTGWGKSLVYFIATRILRERGRGTTIIISPLLELMRNQQEAAARFGLRCAELNSVIKDARKRANVLDGLVAGQIDVFFTTPETLFRNDVQQRLPNIDIGLFVIDEAHCLSDWGHDFRRDYGRLYRVIEKLPSTIPVLCTTATANDRVVRDLEEHLGGDVYVTRGELTRDSLCLQALKLNDRAERYAWISDHINELPGTGIIYCLTKHDCTYLCEFLQSEGIATDTYFSDKMREKQGLNRAAMEKFEHNQIKALVATIKLGMGYDKPDIGFVIHFQRPQNIVAYYQQIGRAGRAIPKAYVMLMSGPEDDKIAESFIRNAFPAEELCREVLLLAQGRSKVDIVANVNDRKARIEKAIYFLEFDGYLRKQGSLYYATPKLFVYDRQHYEEITAIRRFELEQMRNLADTDGCLLEAVTTCLNDPSPHRCGHCANCVGAPLLSENYSPETLKRAQVCINRRTFKIVPRKKWVYAGVAGSATCIEHPFVEGVCLSRYGDAGYGAMVAEDKYHREAYRDELLQRAIEILRIKVCQYDLRSVSFVPSLRNSKVNEFAKRLAEALGLDYLDVLEKKEARPQKEMENSSWQCKNARDSFAIKPGIAISTGTILVDDIVDSRWTLAACADLLGQAGCPCVFPFVLADSSEGESDEQ